MSENILPGHSKPLTDEPLCKLARIIDADWNFVFFGARPYLDALHTMTDMDSKYGVDSADTIIRYFLANCSSWRGQTARVVKAELKRRVGM